MPHFDPPVIPPGPGVFYTCANCNTHFLRKEETATCNGARRNPHKGERLCLSCLTLVCGDA